jgi:hypothetical protein
MSDIYNNLGDLNVPPCIRCTLYKTVFTDMQPVGEADMATLTWEMGNDEGS